MSNRKPYKLTFIIRCYNIAQTAACLYFLWRAHSVGFSFRNTWKCIGTDGPLTKELMELNFIQYNFIVLRIIEYIETIFFCLRKKFDQASFLHVYHHISTVFILILFLRLSGGMMETFFGMINMVVHFIMYGYYFLSSFNQFRKFTNIIKPFLTIIQITQLTIILGHCIAAVLPGCSTIHWLFYLAIFNVIMLLSLFGHFYVKSFIKRKNN